MSDSGEQEKKFTIKHVFKDVKKKLIEDHENVQMIGPVENYFGVEWRLRLLKEKNMYIDFQLDCLHTDGSCKWSIETKFDVFSNGVEVRETKECGFSEDFCSNDNMTFIDFDEYHAHSINDTMPVEFHVTIKKMTGMEKKNLRNFDDDSAKEHSDVMLKIGDHQFYVCKMYLSLHSSYFKTLFSGNFSEAGKSEIELKDVDGEDLQNFLEVIYGEPAINCDNYIAILKLADFFDSKTAVKRCEEFILNKSEDSLETKFELANKYNMEKLKKKCIFEIGSSVDFESIIPENAADIDPDTWKELLKKSITYF